MIFSEEIKFFKYQTCGKPFKGFFFWAWSFQIASDINVIFNVIVSGARAREFG